MKAKFTLLGDLIKLKNDRAIEKVVERNIVSKWEQVVHVRIIGAKFELIDFEDVKMKPPFLELSANP